MMSSLPLRNKDREEDKFSRQGLDRDAVIRRLELSIRAARNDPSSQKILLELEIGEALLEMLSK